VPLLVWFALAVLVIVVVCAVFGAAVAPSDPNKQDLLRTFETPSMEHLLGTDDFGRDVLSRLIAGTRTAVLGPLLIALGAMLIGNILGLLAGYRRGRTDSLIMRWVDLMYALPGLLVAIVVAGVLGGGYFLAVALLIVLYSPYDTRIVRGATLEQRPRPYVEAAVALGLPPRQIMARHIYPNLLPVIVANTFLTFAFALVSLSALSFLGLGAAPEQADWGRMLADSRTHLFDNAAWAIASGAAIVLTAASTNLVGDWLYELLSNRGRAR